MIKKFSLTVFVLLSTFLLATPPPPTGGAGGVTPGAAASPIDMYIYILAVVAVLGVSIYAKRYRTQLK